MFCCNNVALKLIAHCFCWEGAFFVTHYGEKELPLSGINIYALYAIVVHQMDDAACEKEDVTVSNM